MNWKDNTIMQWNNGVAWYQLSDHGRGELDVSYSRIGSDTRMGNGTLRRYQVANKRTWTITYENIPSRISNNGLNTVDGGMCGEELVEFYNTVNGRFNIEIRDGAGQIDSAYAMITDFSKSVIKRGPNTDFWNMSITLEEC